MKKLFYSLFFLGTIMFVMGPVHAAEISLGVVLEEDSSYAYVLNAANDELRAISKSSYQSKSVILSGNPTSAFFDIVITY
jgi:hypothetical protein